METLHEFNKNFLQIESRLTDGTYNNPDIYYDIKTTHVIDEVYQISLAMRKLTKSNGFLKFFKQLELSVKLVIKSFSIIY